MSKQICHRGVGFVRPLFAFAIMPAITAQPWQRFLILRMLAISRNGRQQ